MADNKKSDTCCGTCSNPCGSCNYGGGNKHSAMRLLVVLLMAILIFNLGMEIGELKAQVMSNKQGYTMMRFDKDQAPAVKMMMDLDDADAN